MGIGLSENDFKETSKQSHVDYSICPFKKYKGIEWEMIMDLQYLFWLLNNVDLHPLYEEQIETQLDGYAKCENGHIYETYIDDECFYCKQENDVNV